MKKAKIRNRYNQIPHLNRNTIWGSDKNTRKHHTQEGQEVIPFPAGYHKAVTNRQNSITKLNTNNQKGPQKKQRLERSRKLKHV